MASAPIGTVLRHLRQLASARTLAATPDHLLLERFITNRDEAAFEALLARHGPMVYHVCRRVLTFEHDAEDAFQATFLVLARQARSIRKRASLAGWLHGVAQHIAGKARTSTLRRMARERSTHQPPPQPSPLDDVTWRELRTMLDEELARLPERYRGPLVLCYLEERTQDEAARQLGWSRNTFRRRLERGRELLRHRLTRRGITLSAGLFATLAGGQGTASVAAPLAAAALKVAMAVATGQTAAVSASVVALAQGAVGGIKLKFAVALMLVTVILAAGAVVTYRPYTEQQIAAKNDPRAADSRKPNADAQGDPLPGGEVPRSGIERFRQQGEAIALEFSPDGRILAGYCESTPHCRLVLWDTVTGEEIWQRAVINGQRVNSRPFAFSPDGKIVAVVSLGTGIIHRDVTTGKQVRVLPLPDADGGIGPILLRFSPDGKMLAVALECDVVVVLNAVTGKRVQKAGGLRHTIFAMDFSLDGKMLALGAADPSLHLWNMTTGKRFLDMEQQPKSPIVTSLAFTPDGKTLAAGRCNRIALLEAATGKELGGLEAPMRLINGMAFLPDGKTLASGSQDGKVRIWDLRTRRVRCTLDGGSEGRCLALSPDGRAVALGTVGHAILWNLAAAPNGGRHKEVNLTRTELETLWSDLADKDAAKAHQAIGRMTAAPEQTASFMRRRLQPVAGLDTKEMQRLRRLIANLDSDSFTERETAARELEKVATQAETLLRQTLAANPSLEVRRRIERILGQLDRQWPASSPEILRTWRAIKILKHIGTTEARQALQDLVANGAPDARLTREAKAALEQLAK